MSVICCANCESTLPSETEGDAFVINQFGIDEIPALVTVSEAVAVIFAHNYKNGNQNCCKVNTLRLCPNCISVMAELYPVFTRFKNHSTGSSYIQHILSDPNWALHDVSCINHLNPDLRISIKEEQEENGNNDDTEWILPEVQISELYPDITITRKSTADISTRLRFRKARIASLHQIKVTKLKAPRKKNINTTSASKSTLTAGEKSSSEAVIASTSSQPPTPVLTHVEREHACPLCPMKCRSIRGLDDHKRKYHKAKSESKPFECTQCVPPKRFSLSNHLTLHERARHPKDDEREFKCENCSLKLGSESGLRIHMKRVHQERLKFYCIHCAKTFSLLRSLSEHVKAAHLGYSAEEKETNSCLVCGKVYPSKLRLKNHQEVIHTPREAAQCSLCDKIFFAQKNYEFHMTQIHSAERKENPGIFSCSHCTETFVSKAGLRAHIDIVHLNKNELICDVCGFKTHAEINFRSHMDCHNTEMKYSCPTCSKLFRTRRALKNHKASHVGRTYPCPHCATVLKKAESLQRHLKARHRDIPEVALKAKSHPCPICGKDFKLREYLRQHLRSKGHGGTGRHQNQVASRKAKSEVKVMMRNTEVGAINYGSHIYDTNLLT